MINKDFPTVPTFYFVGNWLGEKARKARLILGFF
jgi:hypothetical protein